MIDETRWKMSGHALRRAAEMGVTEEEIAACLEEPEETFRSRKYRTPSHRRGRLTLGLSELKADGSRVVITVLYSSREAWESGLREHPVSDREVRFERSEVAA